MTTIYSPAPVRAYRYPPLDVVNLIAAHMPISKVKIAVDGWIVKDADKQMVLRRRSNILLYMKDFFADPAKVLDLIRVCGVVWCKFPFIAST